MRIVVVYSLAVTVVVTCAGCSSSGNSPGASSSGGAGTHAVSGGPSAATVSALASVAPGSDGGISITGAFTAKASITLCTSGIGSIAVHVDGDAETYRGSISARSFGFLGPKAAAYSLKSGQAKPDVSAGGTRFTVKGAELTDVVSGETITAAGTVSCP